MTPRPFPLTRCVCVPTCSINNKLQQPEAASGVLDYAMKHFGELVSALQSLWGEEEETPSQD